MSAGQSRPPGPPLPDGLLAPRQDAPHDWLTSPHVHPDVPDVAELCRELAAAGISSDLTRLLMNFRQGTWLTGAGAGCPSRSCTAT